MAVEPVYPIRLVWRESHHEFFRRRRIFSLPFGNYSGFAVGQTVEIQSPAHLERYANLPARGFCTIGAFSYSISKMHPRARIGRYCSIASDVELMQLAHPTDRITTSPVTFFPEMVAIARDDGFAYQHTHFNGILPEPPVIEHDVWVGAGTLFKGGIRIGTGAIVAARSIITKDVPPYSIVAGAPATVKKMRFPEDIARRLLASRWWDYNYHEIPRCWTEPERFLDLLEEGVAADRISIFDPETCDAGYELCQLD